MSRLRLTLSTFLLFTFLSALRSVAFGQDFSIVVLPDTQNEAQFFPQVMNSQTTWIVNNADARNIQVVLGVGDIVNDGASDAQQQNASAAIKMLDNAGIPYLLAIGNHDYDGANPKSRSVVGFNRWFGPARYAGKAFYKGNFPSGSNENFYGELTIGGTTYLFLMLEFRPRSSSLDWAESILSANPDKEAIVVVHSFLRTTGTREDVCDTQDMPAGNANGEQMWSRLRQHANVIMVLNGHFTGGTVAHRSDVGDNGNLVNQIFADLQTFPNGGNGWLEIITFHPVTNSISVQTFSPFLNQFMTGAAQQFTVPYHNPHPAAGSGAISGKVRNPSTCAPVSGVTVKAGAASAVTAADGTYKFSVTPGSYSVTASKTGVNASTLSETVSDSLTTQLDFYLTASGTGAPCTLNSASPSVTICTPSNNATVTSPVQVTAGATDSNTVSFVQAFLDGKAVVTQNGNKLNASIAMAQGMHRLTVQAKDSAGVVFKQTIAVTAGSSVPTPTPTPTPSACNPGTVSPSVNMCSPANGSTLASPVHVVAATRDSVAVSFVQIYVDGSPVLTKNGGTLDNFVAIAAGAHRVTVQAKDTAGVIFKQTVNITVH